MVLLMVKRLVVLFVLIVLGLFVIGCSARKADPSTSAAAVVTAVSAVPVVETRVVTETLKIPMTVVVTATPVPTPMYVSKVNAASGTLVYPIASEPASLDPQEADDEVGTLVAAQLYEGLFDLREDGSTEPAAAQSLLASSDSKTYTVTLRSGMTWSDGQPVTAQNYVDGVCRLLDPAVGNPYYYLLTDIAAVTRAKEYANGDLADCTKVGVDAADALTLRIALERPAAFLPKLLAMSLFWPAAPAPSAVISGTGVISRTAPISTTLPAGPIVNGPYLLAEQVANDHITLKKNPSYWNAAQVDVEQIEFKLLPDLAKQLARYEAGDVQVAEFPASETPRIEADPGFKQELQKLIRPGVSYLGLNTQSGPTADPAVRRAMAQAIDRQFLINEVLKQPWHVPAQTLIPPGVPGHQGDKPDVGLAYNPEAARAALAEAGYGPDKPVPPVELWYNREGNNEAIFKAVGEMLEAVGIPVRLVSSSWNVYRDALDACNQPNRASASKTPAQCPYNLYRMGWVMDYADASNLLDVVLSPKSAFQYTGWQSADYEKLMAEAAAEPDEARRTELYSQAERILLNDQVAVIPLQYYDRTVLVKNGVEFNYPPFGPPRFKDWKAP
jgi:oligopeptide transport system substrate-binding protein